jgi:hypothetical protein
MSHQCAFCKKEFARETSIAVHMCEPKRRRSERSERGVELGFQSYLRFYEIAQGSVLDSKHLMTLQTALTTGPL